MFVTVSVTLPELTSTELGSNVKLATVIVAVEHRLPPQPTGWSRCSMCSSYCCSNTLRR